MAGKKKNEEAAPVDESVDAGEAAAPEAPEVEADGKSDEPVAYGPRFINPGPPPKEKA